MRNGSDIERLSIADWETGYSAYTVDRTISSVKRALHCGYLLAKALVKDGCSKRGWPSYEARWEEEQERERKLKYAVASCRDDERVEFLRFHEMYRHLRDGASTFFKTSGESGVEPKKALVQGLQDLMELSENLRRKQRELMHMVVLPFEDMTDEEIAEWAKGKRRPRR